MPTNRQRATAFTASGFGAGLSGHFGWSGIFPVGGIIFSFRFVLTWGENRSPTLCEVTGHAECRDKTVLALVGKGIDLWHKGRPEDALPCYVEARAALTAHVPAARRVEVEKAYALCLCAVGDVDEALRMYPDLHAFCVENGLDAAEVLRQWAKAREEIGDFAGARKTYERARPDDGTSPDDRLKWNHALGLLNWRDGRLSEARANLRAATDLLPEDPEEALKVLAVLGNDALLSLELGDLPRAFRLADRMLDLRGAAEETTLSNEVNLIEVRAALARQQGHHEVEARILRGGVAFIAERAPTSWPHRLSLAGDYVEARLRAGQTEDAIPYLSALCEAAPEHLSWLGAYMRARLYIDAGQIEEAARDIVAVLSAFLGNGSPESEIGILIELAALCDKAGNGMAAIFLGKMMLKQLAAIAGTFEGAEVRQVIVAGDEATRLTCRHLHARGRFEEALALENLGDRIQRDALVRGARTAFRCKSRAA